MTENTSFTTLAKPKKCYAITVAVSQGEDPTGPYVPQPEPLSCRLDQGRSIDPAGFTDTNGRRYVVFKVDGNSIGNGGDCNNSIPPIQPTPILLQEVAEDGYTLIGDAVQILDRDESDGPLVEAPNLILEGDTYFLFYSSWCFTDPQYNVLYATSKNINGPYQKTGNELLKTGMFGLQSPGSATACQCGSMMLFHGFCGKNERCMYSTNLGIDQTSVKLVS